MAWFRGRAFVGFGSVVSYSNQVAKLSVTLKTNGTLTAIHVGPVEVFLRCCWMLPPICVTRAIFQFIARLPLALHPCLLDLRSPSTHRRNSKAEQKQRHLCLHWQRLPVEASNGLEIASECVTASRVQRSDELFGRPVCDFLDLF